MIRGPNAFLAIAAATAVLVAACGEDDSNQLAIRGGGGGSNQLGPGANGTPPGEGSSPGAPGSGSAPTNSTAGKEYYATNVHPILSAKCGACHEAGGVGNPSWMVKADPAKTYELVYANGWVLPAGSRITDKGVHNGGAAPALSDAEKTTFAVWVAIEVKDGGNKAQVNVLEKFGGCLDAQKFAAIGLEKLVTTRRTNDNNTNNVTPWAENANNCTGCNAAPCRTCHSLDDATGFVLALGNPNVPATTTFEETKKILPPYLQKYVATGPDGKPIASNGLQKKSDATKRDKAYTHPMFTVPAEMQTRIDAFVADAIAKWTAGTCGK